MCSPGWIPFKACEQRQLVVLPLLLHGVKDFFVDGVDTFHPIFEHNKAIAKSLLTKARVDLVRIRVS